MFRPVHSRLAIFIAPTPPATLPPFSIDRGKLCSSLRQLQTPIFGLPVLSRAQWNSWSICCRPCTTLLGLREFSTEDILECRSTKVCGLVYKFGGRKYAAAKLLSRERSESCLVCVQRKILNVLVRLSISHAAQADLCWAIIDRKHVGDEDGRANSRWANFARQHVRGGRKVGRAQKAVDVQRRSDTTFCALHMQGNGRRACTRLRRACSVQHFYMQHCTSVRRDWVPVAQSQFLAKPCNLPSLVRLVNAFKISFHPTWRGTNSGLFTQKLAVAG